MPRELPVFLLLAALAVPASAAVDGTVVNRTIGKPQPGVTVTLFKLSAGMEPAGSVKADEQGRFRLPQDVQGPSLLQAAFQGVTYNHMLQPGAPASGVNLEVFEASSQPGAAKLGQHFLIFQPAESQLTVTEGFVFNNAGNTTYNDPERGTLRFMLPKGAASVRVQATAPNGMPLERPAGKTAQAGVYKVDFAVKPGETRFEVNYTLPYTPPVQFESRLLYPDIPTSLVAPPGVEIKGAGLELKGQEPRSQANVYEVKPAAFKLEIAGAMSPAAEASGEPSIEQVLPRIHGSLVWLLVLAFAILSLGFVLLYRARLVESTPPAASQPAKGTHERRRR